MKRLTVYEWIVVMLSTVCILICAGRFLFHRTPSSDWRVQTERYDPIMANRPDSDLNTDGLLPGEVIDLNTATRSDLLRLPNIGAVRADAILAYRTANGPFSSTDDLLNVPGIGPVTLNRLRPYLSAG